MVLALCIVLLKFFELFLGWWEVARYGFLWSQCLFSVDIFLMFERLWERFLSIRRVYGIGVRAFFCRVFCGKERTGYVYVGTFCLVLDFIL